MAKKLKAEKLVDEVENSVPDNDKMVAFGNRLFEQFDMYKRLRKGKETEWLQSLRQHKGIYDPETAAKFEKNSSRVYPKITKAKDNMVLSKLHEMLFPGNDRNWSVEPTPVPMVSTKIASAIALNLVRTNPETGEVIVPQPKDISKGILEYSKMAAEDMQKEMDDQFLEMKYTINTGKPVLRSGVIYGTGICKGPLVESAKRVEWSLDRKKAVMNVIDVNIPYYQFVPIWNWYPDMTVTEQEDMTGSFERHVYSKHQLRQLMKLKGFNTQYIEDYLTNHASGDYKPSEWESDLRAIKDADNSSKSRTEDGDYIDMGSGGEGTANNVKYEVLEYWGFVDSEDLEACGEKIPAKEKQSEISANVWLLGKFPIKAIVNPEPKRLDVYHLFYYDKDETSIFGEGLPVAIRHSQLAISGSARMMLNNAAVCSGAQIEMNWDLMDTEVTDPTDVHPMKVWIRRGQGADSQYPALRFYNIESHIPEYMNLIQQFQQFGDIESTLPTWMISEPLKSANETAGAVSMKMGTINVSIRDIVRNFDDFTESTVESLYLWNMEYSPKASIKGDYKVKTRGSTALIMKEIKLNALNMFQAAMQPEDWAYMPRRQFLVEKAKANELDLEIRSEEEAQKYIQSMQDMRLKELQYKDLEAEISKKNAMSLNLASKAKETGVSTAKAITGGMSVIKPQAGA